MLAYNSPQTVFGRTAIIIIPQNTGMLQQISKSTFDDAPYTISSPPEPKHGFLA